MRKAKAYILFYVERSCQVASDKTATNSTATNKPAVDTAAADGVSVSSEAATQDEAVGDTVATDRVLTDVSASHMVTLDGKASDNATLENVSKHMAALDEADTASAEAAADSDTSDKTATEEAGQAIQMVAQWFLRRRRQLLTLFGLHLSHVSHSAWLLIFTFKYMCNYFVFKTCMTASCIICCLIFFFFFVVV